MDMTKYASGKDKVDRNWLKTSTLMDMGVTEIQAVIQDVRTFEFDDDKEKPILDLAKGEEFFSFTLNIVNTNTMIKLYGKDSDNWLHKDIVIKLEKTDYQGDRVPCLRIED